MISTRILAIVLPFTAVSALPAATTQKRYYAHEAVEDEHGVIAPWYQGANGQIDERIRVAVQTLKRYPWSSDKHSETKSLPEYIYNGAWKIAADGKITIPDINNWSNGDLAQRAAYILGSLIDYYRYSGDSWAVDVVRMQADALLDNCLTPDDHPWPRFLISVPVRGKPYGKADPQGLVQLDIVAEVGIQMVRAAELCGSERYMEAARHWADLFAAKRIREQGVNPWPRYANPQDAPWEDISTGSMTYILEFFDTLIATGYTGADNAIVEARQAGVEYLRDVLLPDWLRHDVWGRNYWDWPCHVQVETTTEYVCRYLMNHPEEFANWRNDVRNIATLFTHRTCADPGSAGDTFSGAWAYPESSSCCGRSLWYAPLEIAPVYAQYAWLLSNDPETGAWARELARRQMILATYDFLPTGVVEDGIDGGPVVAGGWFKIAHPMALKHCLAAIAWMPEVFAPPGENHVVRSTHTVNDVQYRSPGEIRFKVARGSASATTVARTAFEPTQARAGEQNVTFEKKRVEGGDFIITLQHPAGQMISLSGAPPSKPVATRPWTGNPGGGPTGPQRWIFGYPGREDYIDSAGQAWRPATEWIIRSGDGVDTVAAAWYTQHRQLAVLNSSDPELYRHGAHGTDFWVDFTVAPGTYHARLKFCEVRNLEPRGRAVTVLINGEQVVNGLDIAATAAAAAGTSTQPVKLEHTTVQAGMGRAVDLVFNNVKPKNGLVSIRLKGTYGGEAIVSAIEVGPGDGGKGAPPVTAAQPAPAPRKNSAGNLLNNGGFEEGGPRDLGSLGKTGHAAGWNYTFAGAGQCYIWAESDYAAHPDWGLPAFHSGKQAVRTHADRSGHTIIWQDVNVDGGKSYAASVWVRAADLHGKGFGMSAADSAGLLIQEFDQAGKEVAEHGKKAVSVASEYRRLEQPFTTMPATVRVRFILDTVIDSAYDQGHVTYDDCTLVVQP